MFLLNSCLGLFSAARSLWRPFSRSYGTILPSSLTALLPSALGSSPHLPVSVCGTGATAAIAAFLDARPALSPTSVRSSPDACFGKGVCLLTASSRFPGLSVPGRVSRTCPHSSVPWQGRTLHLLSIGYGFRPRLRPRLSQGRSALPWNPWIFGLKDSHFHLATRSGILSSQKSTRTSVRASSLCQCSPTNHTYVRFHGFGGAFQPRTFSARGLSTSELLRTL